GSTVTLLVGRPTLDPKERDRSYACLKGFERVFEIRTDKFRDVFAPADVLRDSQLARFKPEDARTVEITTGGAATRPRKEDKKKQEKTGSTEPPGRTDDWKIVRPIQAGADVALVRDLLDKLSTLNAQDKDVLDKHRFGSLAAGLGLPALPAAPQLALS